MKIVENMKKKDKFDLDDLKVKKAYVFDAGFGSKEKVINFSSSIIYLVNEDESAGILYNELPEHDHIVGQHLDKEKRTLTTRSEERRVGKEKRHELYGEQSTEE